MSHPEQLGFLRLCRDHLCASYRDPEYIEIGSYDLHGGGIRNVFTGVGRYVGVDLVEGPGVDVVASGHEIAFEDNSFDVAISSECFEHNPYWAETFENMHRMLRPGGLLIMTCATTGRVEHGTDRTNPDFSPGTTSRGWSYYRNLTRRDFESRFDLASMFQLHRFYTAQTSNDLYFVGYKPGAEVSHDIAALDRGVAMLSEERRRGMSLPKRVARNAARAPLGVLSRLVPETTFQNIAVPYSKVLYRIGSRFGLGI